MATHVASGLGVRVVLVWFRLESFLAEDALLVHLTPMPLVTSPGSRPEATIGPRVIAATVVRVLVADSKGLWAQ